MKAKFIQIDKAMEIRLEDGTIYKSNKGENSKAFTKRVTEAAALDQGDLEISELTTDTFAKIDVDKLKIAKSKETGLLADLIQKAIDLRTPDVMAGKGKEVKNGLSAEAQKNIDAINNREANKAAADKAKADVAAEKATKKAEADKVKAEAKAKKDEEKAAKKAEREAAKTEKPTVEAILEAAAAAKVNVGHTVTFQPHRTAMKTEGVVNGVWVDKRVPMALYRIFDADGVMYNKVIDAPDLKFGDIAPNPKAEEKKAAAEKKEADKKAVAEKKEADKLAKAVEKELAAAAKLEEAQKKAAEKLQAAKDKAEKLAQDAAEKAVKAKELADAKAKEATDKLAATAKA